MKKLLVTLTILFIMVFVAKAQDTGKIWIGGSVGIQGESIDYKLIGGDNPTEKTFSFKVIPEIGYILSDKIGIGIKLGYGQVEYDSGTMDGAKFKTFTVNPFMRCSMLRGDLGGLFVDTGVGYSLVKEKSHDWNYKHHLFEVGFRPGVSLNVSSKVALTAKFGFLGYKLEDRDGSTKKHIYGFDFSLDQALLGVNFIF